MGKIHGLIQCYLPGAVSSKLSRCHWWEERVCVTLPPVFSLKASVPLPRYGQDSRQYCGTLLIHGFGDDTSREGTRGLRRKLSSDLEVSLGAWVGSPWPLLATLGRRGHH